MVETGLGGRLDSTNVLPASSVLCSVITNIGLDHTELLGTSLAAIAVEKAGIMKRGVPCVIGETQGETESVFESEAERQGSPIYWADQHEYLRRFRVRYASECQLKGVYQEHNLQTAYVTLRLLQREHPELGLTREAIAEGFARVCELTGLRGRWEQVAAHPLTICDTGHNVHGLREVFAQLSDLHRRYGGVLRMVFGMVKDKDIATVRRMLPKDAVYYFCQAHTPRAVPAQMTVEEAVRQAQKHAAAEDLIFIGGSNYVVGEALPLFDAVS